MQDLKTLISHIEKGRTLHISILDLNGILNSSMTRIGFQNTIHSKRFCDIAKITEKGYKTCQRCKMMADRKAITQKKPFEGYCLYGLYEAAHPVVIGGDVAAIVYVGNAVVDEKTTIKRIRKTCSRTGLDERLLLEQLKKCEALERREELGEIAEIVADYIKLLFERVPGEEPALHWIVSLLKRHADERYYTELSLKELARTYQKNEKYVGRLFKEQMGVSFSEYCTELRLKRAEELLRAGNEKIIDVALDCGFGNISYFNHLFRKKYGMSPGAYRRQNRSLAGSE